MHAVPSSHSISQPHLQRRHFADEEGSQRHEGRSAGCDDCAGLSGFLVASAYVYHHRGVEVGSSLEKGVPQMGPEEGVPEKARRMSPIIHHMEVS